MHTTHDDTVKDVVDHVKEASEKYGFTPDEDSVRDSVEESANLLGYALTEDEILAACDQILGKD